MRRKKEELTSNSKSKSKSGYGDTFDGFKEIDFSEDVTGTSWRSRASFGGAVTRLLDSHSIIESWAPYNQAIIHWAAIDSYEKDNARNCLKLFCAMVKKTSGEFSLMLRFR